MTLHEAYLKAKSRAETYGFTVFTACGDYGAFWGFAFIPKDVKEVNGPGDITVDKKTGELGSLSTSMMLELWDKCINIPIEQFADYNVAV
jgi:succinate-acetate transporter protein